MIVGRDGSIPHVLLHIDGVPLWFVAFISLHKIVIYREVEVKKKRKSREKMSHDIVDEAVLLLSRHSLT